MDNDGTMKSSDGIGAGTHARYRVRLRNSSAWRYSGVMIEFVPKTSEQDARLR